MLNKNQTSKSRLIWLLLLIPMLGMTSVLFARTEKKADMIEFENIYPTDANLSAKLAQDGYLIGRVIDDNGPVAEARVSVINLNGMVSYSCLTDQDGNFILREYNPEKRIRIIKTGYKEFKGIINSDNPVVSLTKLKDNGNAGNERDSQLMEALEMEVDELPEFPGGTVSLLEYLRKNMKYPAICRENNVQGKVVVSFTIDTDGSITDAEVVQSVDPLLDAEALRTISQMPTWKPGKKDGNIVRVRYSVPINFRLDNKNDNKQTWISIYPTDSPRSSFKTDEKQFVIIHYRTTHGEDNAISMDNLESAIEDLVNGKRTEINIPDSPENYKKAREILNKKTDKNIMDFLEGIIK